MLIRLKNLDIISENFIQEFTSQGLIRIAEDLGYDTSLYKPSNKTEFQSKFIPLAKKAYKEGKISQGKFSELLRIVDLTTEDVVSEEEFFKGNSDYNDI